MLVAARALQGAFGATARSLGARPADGDLRGISRSAQGVRDLQRDRRRRRVGRPAARRRAHPGDVLALEPLRQPRDRGTDGDRGACGCCATSASRPARRSICRASRSPRAACSRSSTASRTPRRRSWSNPITVIALALSAVLLSRLRRARATRRASAAAAAHRLGSGPRRGVRDDRAGRFGRVRRLPVPHLLHAAEPRLLAAEDRPGLPAHDRHDRPHRHHGADEGSAPHRRQASGGDRHDARDHRDAAVHAAARRTGPYVSHVLPGLLLTGVGMGCIFAPAFSTATLGVKSHDAGIASAMVNTSQQVGGSVGTALLSTIFASAAASFASAHAKTAGLASAASIHGYTTAFAWAAALFGVGLLVALLILPSDRRRARAASPKPKHATTSPSAWKRHDHSRSSTHDASTLNPRSTRDEQRTDQDRVSRRRFHLREGRPARVAPSGARPLRRWSVAELTRARRRRYLRSTT